MSDYDDMGFAPGECCDQEEAHCAEQFDDVALGTLCCKGLNRVENHVSGTRKDEDHVDIVREIQTRKEDANEYEHDGGARAAKRNRLATRHTTTNGNHNTTNFGSGNDDGDPERRNHIDTCHVVESRDVTIHEESEDGDSRAMPLREQSVMVSHGKVWCSAKQNYRVADWSTTEGKQTESQPHREINDEKCLAPLMSGGNTRRMKRAPHEDDFEEDDSDFEGNKLLCDMRGERWESLLFANCNRFRSLRISYAS